MVIISLFTKKNFIEALFWSGVLTKDDPRKQNNIYPEYIYVLIQSSTQQALYQNYLFISTLGSIA